MKNILFLLTFVLTISCENNYFEKIEIPENKIEEVTNAMEVVTSLLYKTQFDTIAIKKYKIKCQYELDVSQSFSKNTDSIYKSVIKNFNFEIYKPFTKGLSYDITYKSVILNEREVARNLNEFIIQINDYKELDNLSFIEKQSLISAFKVLYSNNIVSYFKTQDLNYYTFRYSKTGVFQGESFETYLYLKKDIKNQIHTKQFKVSNIFLDQRKEIMLFKGNRH